MKQTAVEWFNEEINKLNVGIDARMFIAKLFEKAKEMEETMVTEYAEFCVRCDRAGLPLVKFEDWLKELTFKSEKQ